MADQRKRSEYRFTIPQNLRILAGCEPPAPSDREELAELMLDGYRGTIDDEDETMAETLAAVDFYLA